MKQSSVEWMVEQIEKSSKEGDIDFLLWNLKQNLLVEAKAMHKEEIENAYASGQFDRKIGNFDNDFFDKTFNIEEPDLIQINQNNPVTKGSTTLIKNL